MFALFQCIAIFNFAIRFLRVQSVKNAISQCYKFEMCGFYTLNIGCKITVVGYTLLNMYNELLLLGNLINSLQIKTTVPNGI